MGEPTAGPLFPREFEGVVLESYDGASTATAAGLTLRIDESGISVSGGAAGSSRHAAWRHLSDLRCGDPGVLPDGRPAVVLAASLAGNRLRWLVPADQLDPETAGQLDRVLEAQGAAAPPASGALPPAEAPLASEASQTPSALSGTEPPPEPRRPSHAAGGEDVASPVMWAPPPRAPGRQPAHARPDTLDAWTGIEPGSTRTPSHAASPPPMPWERTVGETAPVAGLGPPAASLGELPPPASLGELPPPASLGELPPAESPSTASLGDAIELPPVEMVPLPGLGDAGLPPPPAEMVPLPGFAELAFGPPLVADSPATGTAPATGSNGSPPAPPIGGAGGPAEAGAQPGTNGSAARPAELGYVNARFGQPGYGEAFPGTGWWWPSGAVEPTTPADTRRVTPAIAALLVVIALLVVAAVVVPFAAGSGSTTGSPSPAARLRQLARQVNVVRSDLPGSWTVDRRSDGPLSSFLGSGPAGGAQSPSGQTQLQGQVASQFEQCMGISASADRIFGPAGTTPAAQASSPAFAAPAGTGSPVQEVGSSTGVYSSSSAVAADVAQVRGGKFPSCFGEALATSFIQAGQQSSGGSAQFGTPQVQPVQIPSNQGIVTSGAQVTIAVTAHGVTVPLQFGVIFVGGGRFEATLYTYSSESPFPSALTTSLAGTLAQRVATAEGSSVGV